MRVVRVAGPLVLVVTLVVAGCSDRYDGRVEVTGTVMLNGEPLKEGLVCFSPLDGQDTQAQVTVSAGKYRIEREHGLKPGKYLIRVSAGDGKTPYLAEGEAPGPSGGNIVSKDLVPREWNIDSKHERTVTKDNPNSFDFDIR